MAQSEHVIHLRISVVSGLATCDVCSALRSFKLEPPELERKIDQLYDMRCSSCGGSVHVEESSLHVAYQTSFDGKTWTDANAVEGP